MRLPLQALLMFSLVLACGAAQANDVLILLRSDRVGNAISPDLFAHGGWVKWPKSWDSAGASPFLSLLSGHDWKSSASDLSFKTLEDEDTMMSLSQQSLEMRGYHQARRGVVGPESPVLLLFEDQSRSAEAMLVALGYDGLVHTASVQGPYPKGRLLVYDARGWDDAAEVARRARGRALVLEYPPERGKDWSPVWFFGQGWPEGLPVSGDYGVPGLLPARSVGVLLTEPEQFRWTDNRNPGWRGAGYWLRALRDMRAHFLLILGGMATLAFVAGAVAVANERRSFLARALIAAALLLLPAAMLAGLFGPTFGPSFLPFWTGTCFAGLLSIAGLLGFLSAKLIPGASPLLGYSVVALVASLAANPAFSLVSGALGSARFAPSVLATGCLLAAVCGVVAFSSKTSMKAHALTVFAGAASLVAGAVANPWWLRVEAALPVLAIAALAAAGLIRIALGGTLLYLVFELAQSGFRYANTSMGRIGSLQEANAISFGEIAAFLISPLWLGSVLLTLLLLAIGGKFFSHQIGLLVRTDPRRIGLLQAAGLVLLIGLVVPYWLHAGVILAIAGALVLLFEGTRAL